MTQTVRAHVLARLAANAHPAELAVRVADTDTIAVVLLLDDGTATYRDIVGYPDRAAADAALGNVPDGMLAEYLLHLDADTLDAVCEPVDDDGVTAAPTGTRVAFTEDEVAFA